MSLLFCLQRVLRRGPAAQNGNSHAQQPNNGWLSVDSHALDPAFLDLRTSRLDDEHWAVKALSGKPAASVKAASSWRLDDRESYGPVSQLCCRLQLKSCW